MKLLPLLLACLLASCIGPPDRLGITVGHGHGDGTLDGYKHDFSIDSESSWVAGTLEFPISWSRQPRPTPVVLYVPAPATLAAAPAAQVIAAPATTEPVAPAAEPASPSAPAPAPAQAAIVPAAKEDKPWWEDFHAVQALVIALGAALATRYGRPAYEQVRSYVKPRAKAKATPASSKPPG